MKKNQGEGKLLKQILKSLCLFLEEGPSSMMVKGADTDIKEILECDESIKFRLKRGSCLRNIIDDWKLPKEISGTMCSDREIILLLYG